MASIWMVCSLQRLTSIRCWLAGRCHCGDYVTHVSGHPRTGYVSNGGLLAIYTRDNVAVVASLNVPLVYAKHQCQIILQIDERSCTASTYLHL